MSGVPQRILGIDPGTQHVGFACIELSPTGRAPGRSSGAHGPDAPVALRASNVIRANRPGRSRVLVVEAIALGRGRSLSARLAVLQEAMETWIRDYQPSIVAVEEAFCGRSIQSALRIGEARGVVLATAGRHGLETREFAPARIKRSVTGNGRADKAQVGAMACQAFGLTDFSGRADATDALAVALCCLNAESGGLTEALRSTGRR